MKSAIYIEQGTTQVVLTAENEWERRIIAMLASDQHQLRKFKGGFYECQGGWVRQSQYESESSLMFRLDKVAPEMERVEP